mmetsp:Transcript_14509/g.25504  ORF Transcript_14509/g.25504 Transcript_14509/m.25504 type:complete len:356 (-) Transcript_14509:1240-2307(-)
MGQTNNKNINSTKGRNISEIDKKVRAHLKAGIKFNLKVVIRGARATGKSTLLSKLQGKGGTQNEYTPTCEIQVSHVRWRAPNLQEVVKVEAWDVVDNAIALTQTEHNVNVDDIDSPAGLPMPRDWQRSSKQEGSHKISLLDSQLVDVYKGAHGGIFLYDPRNRDTYIQMKELLKQAPANIPLLVVRNFCDEQRAHVVAEDEVELFIRTVVSEDPSRSILHSQCSMKDNFGLKIVYEYFSVPFLQLRREHILSQLTSCENDIKMVDNKISSAIGQQNYENYKSLIKLANNEKVVQLKLSEPGPCTTLEADAPTNKATQQKAGKSTLDAFLDDVDSDDDLKELEKKRNRQLVLECVK